MPAAHPITFDVSVLGPPGTSSAVVAIAPGLLSLVVVIPTQHPKDPVPNGQTLVTRKSKKQYLLHYHLSSERYLPNHSCMRRGREWANLKALKPDRKPGRIYIINKRSQPMRKASS